MLRSKRGKEVGRYPFILSLKVIWYEYIISILQGFRKYLIDRQKAAMVTLSDASKAYIFAIEGDTFQNTLYLAVIATTSAKPSSNNNTNNNNLPVVKKAETQRSGGFLNSLITRVCSSIVLYEPSFNIN
jgi:hypothetical protein